MLGVDVKELENLVKHFAVLGGDAHHRLNLRRCGLKAFDHRCHFDGLGAGTENDENFGGCGHSVANYRGGNNKDQCEGDLAQCNSKLCLFKYEQKRHAGLPTANKNIDK